MMMEAMTQPTAIHNPPNKIQATLSNRDRGDIVRLLRRGIRAYAAKSGSRPRRGQYVQGEREADFLCAHRLEFSSRRSSAADLKFLHHLPRTRLRNFKSKSGTRIICLLVPF
jgi:hypothetical protein